MASVNQVSVNESQAWKVSSERLSSALLEMEWHPTEAGNLFLLSARESVRQALLGIDRVQAFLRVQTKDLHVGYSTYLNTKLLDIVRRLQLEGIGSMTVTRESLLTHQAVAGVLRGDLHLGFGILPIKEPDLQSRVLMEEALVACLPVGHRLSGEVYDSAGRFGK